jgi:hypothetical protein
MTKIIGLFGCGNIGKRYLQSLKKIKEPLNIFIYDINNDSLSKAILAYNEIKIKNDHKLISSIMSDKTKFESYYDLAILSSSSASRYEILLKITKYSNIKNFILEKILFQSVVEYENSSKILKSKKAWVNCANRTMKDYRHLASFINRDYPIEFEIYGSNWGMACNAIHYLDFFQWITKSNKLEIDSNNLDKKLYSSKREGFIEIFGNFSAKVGSNTINLSCLNVEDTTKEERKMVIKNHTKVINIFPNQNVFEVKVNNVLDARYEFYEDRISDYMNVNVENILNDQDIELPTFEESKETHLIFLKFLIKHMEVIMPNKRFEKVPIT